MGLVFDVWISLRWDLSRADPLSFFTESEGRLYDEVCRRLEELMSVRSIDQSLHIYTCYTLLLFMGAPRGEERLGRRASRVNVCGVFP